jgi:Tfp pilus assembly protein PilO
MAEKTEKEKNTKAKTSLVLIIFLAVAIFAALTYFLVWPQYEKISETQRKIETQKVFLNSQNNTLADIKKLIANYESISQADREKLASMLPETVDEPGLFVLFETLASKNKMSLLAIDISEKEPPADLKSLGIKEVDIAANLSGGEYANMKNLLGDIESNLRLMDIMAVNYTPDTASLTLNIKTYHLDLPPAKSK